MAQDDPSAMPFGYAFEESLGHHDSRYPPSGPPLLNDSEHDLINTFWNNPDNAALAAGESLFAFDFCGDHQDATHIFAPDFANPPFNQNMTPPNFQPLPAQAAPTPNEPPGEEGSLVARALMSMAYTEGDSQRAPQRRHTDTAAAGAIDPFVSNVLSAAQYPTEQHGHPAPHNPVHAPNMNNYHTPTNAQPWEAPVRPTMLSDGLPFDTDQTFATGGARSAFNSYNSNGTMRKMSQEAIENHIFVPIVNHSPNFLDNSLGMLTYQGGKQTTPSSVNRMIEAANRLSHAEQTSKRLRMEPPRTHSMPTLGTNGTPNPKTERKSDNSRRSSSASNDSADDSISPAANGKTASAKRRQKAASATAKAAAAASKRQKLSSEQRKINHIQSEKRRRGEMQRGYAALDKLVPSLKSVGLSKAQVLQHTVVFLDALIQGNQKVEEEIARREQHRGLASGGGPG